MPAAQGMLSHVPLFDSELGGEKPLATLCSALDPLAMGSSQFQRLQNLRSDRFGNLYARGGSSILSSTPVAGGSAGVLTATAWKVCGTGADDASVGDLAWSNPANIQGIDGLYAVATSAVSFQTHYLTATNFGFTSGDIPPGATINGVQFRFTRMAADFAGVDVSIKAIKAGVIGGTDQSTGEVWSNGVLRADTFGGSANLWGEAFVQGDIVGVANFGVALSADPIVVGTETLSVDAVECRVWFTPASGSTTVGACLGLWCGLLDNVQYVIAAHVVTDADGTYTRIYTYNTSTWAATELSGKNTWEGPAGLSRLTNTTNRVSFCVIRKPRRYYFGSIQPARDVLAIQNGADDPRIFDPRYNVGIATSPQSFNVHTAVTVPTGAQQVRKTYRYARHFAVAHSSAAYTFNNTGGTFSFADTSTAPYNSGSNYCILVSAASMASGAHASARFAAAMICDGQQLAMIVEGPLAQVTNILNAVKLDANTDNLAYGSIVSAWQTIYDPTATGGAAEQASYDIVTFDAANNRHFVLFYGLASISGGGPAFYHLRMTRVAAGNGTTTDAFKILMVAAPSVNSFIAGSDFCVAYRDESSEYESPRFVSSFTAAEWLKNQGGPDTGLKLPDLGLLGLPMQLDFTVYYKNTNSTADITGGLNGTPSVGDIYVAAPIMDVNGNVTGLSDYYWIHRSTMFSAVNSGGKKWTQAVHSGDSFIAESTENWTFMSRLPASTQADISCPAPSSWNEGMPIGTCMEFANNRTFVGGLYEAGTSEPGTFAFSWRVRPFRFQPIPIDDTGQVNPDAGSRGDIASDTIQGFFTTSAAAWGSSRIFMVGSQSTYSLSATDHTTGNLYDDSTSLSRATVVCPHGTQDPGSIAVYANQAYWIDQEGQWIEYENGKLANLSRNLVDDKPKAIPAARRGTMQSVYFKDRLWTSYTPAAGTSNSRMLGFSAIFKYWECDDQFFGSMNGERMVRFNDSTYAGTGQRLLIADLSGGALRCYDEGSTEWDGASNIAVRFTSHSFPFWIYSGTMWHRRLIPNPEASRHINRISVLSDQVVGGVLTAQITYAWSGATFQTQQPLDNGVITGCQRWGDDVDAAVTEVTATGLDPGGTSAYVDITATVTPGWRVWAVFAELHGDVSPSDRVSTAASGT